MAAVFSHNHSDFKVDRLMSPLLLDLGIYGVTGRARSVPNVLRGITHSLLPLSEHMAAGASRIIGQPLFSISLCPQPFEAFTQSYSRPFYIVFLSLFSVCFSLSFLAPCPLGSFLQVLLILLCAYTISICVFS